MGYAVGDCLLPELIGWQATGDPPDIPETSHDELTQHQPNEDRQQAVEPSASAIPQDQGLEDPRQEKGSPDKIDLPRGRDGECQRMKRPPRKPNAHPLQEK